MPLAMVEVDVAVYPRMYHPQLDTLWSKDHELKGTFEHHRSAQILRSKLVTSSMVKTGLKVHPGGLRVLGRALSNLSGDPAAAGSHWFIWRLRIFKPRSCSRSCRSWPKAHWKGVRKFIVSARAVCTPCNSARYWRQSTSIKTVIHNTDGNCQLKQFGTPTLASRLCLKSELGKLLPCASNNCWRLSRIGAGNSA